MNKQKALNIRVTNVESIYLMLFTIFTQGKILTCS